MGVGITVRGIPQPPSKYSPEDTSLASAAAPRTPDLGPRVATLTSARSREGGLARRMTSLRAALSMSSPASMTPPPTATTSGLKMFTNPARPTPSHLPASSSTESATSSPSRAGRWLGVGLAGFVNIFNPEVVAVGGGVMEAGELILRAARKEVILRARPPSRDLADVKVATLGPKSGVLGAAALARDVSSGEYLLGG